jgi:hypothetical protein
MMRREHVIGLVTVAAGLILNGCMNTVAQPLPRQKPGLPDPRSGKELAPRGFDRIPAGTVVGDKAAEGWTHIVSVAKPSLGSGDVDQAPGPAVSLTDMFWPAILAKVKKDGQGHVLDTVAIGYALPVGDKRVIATSTDRAGAKLGLFGPQVMKENEKFLDDSRQPAYTATMQVFDIPGLVLRDNEHRPMFIRHAVLVNPKTGELASVHWLMEKEGDEAYPLADAEAQVLPPNYREDRVLNVKADKISFGIPSPDAFAQVRLGQGRAAKWTPALKQTAGLKKFTTKTAADLEAGLRELIGDRWPQAK